MQSSVKRQKHIEPSKSHFPPKLVFCLNCVWLFSESVFCPPPLSLPIHYLFEICMEEPRSPAACLSWLLAGNYWSVNWRLETWGGGYRNGQILIFSLLKWLNATQSKDSKFALEIPKLDYNIMG